MEIDYLEMNGYSYCPACGGVVANRTVHTRWHTRLDDVLQGVAVAAAERFEIEQDDGPGVVFDA